MAVSHLSAGVIITSHLLQCSKFMFSPFNLAKAHLSACFCLVSRNLFHSLFRTYWPSTKPPALPSRHTQDPQSAPASCIPVNLTSLPFPTTFLSCSSPPAFLLFKKDCYWISTCAALESLLALWPCDALRNYFASLPRVLETAPLRFWFLGSETDRGRGLVIGVYLWRLAFTSLTNKRNQNKEKNKITIMAKPLDYW